jgi:thiamine-monophosphate kinase
LRALALPDPFALALSGGEDYELLFCVPRERASEVEAVLEGKGVGATRIGEIREGAGIEVVRADGTLYIPSGRGFDHFG